MQVSDSSLTTDLGNLFLLFAVGNCRQSAISWHVCTGQVKNTSQFESFQCFVLWNLFVLISDESHI